MKILITGGCGFIGSHLTEKLITNNYDVYYAFLMRERDDIDFNDIVETYINCFVCEQDFIDYNNEVTLNDY